MKSNSSASATSNTMTHRAACTFSIVIPAAKSGVFEDDALDHIGYIFTLVGNGFQQFVDRLELDHLAHIGLLAKELAHGSPHHTVCIGLQPVDFLASLQGRFGRILVGNMAQQLDGIAQALTALEDR